MQTSQKFWVGSAVALISTLAVGSAQAQTAVGPREDGSCDYTASGAVVRVAPARGTKETDVLRGAYYFQATTPQLGKLSALLKFAVVTVVKAPASGVPFDVIYTAIDTCGEVLKHPELKNVPLFASGNSAQGRYAFGLAMSRPDRSIGFCANVPAGLSPMQPTAEQRAVPGMFFAGEVDALVPDGINSSVAPLMRYARPRGAPWAKIEVQGMGHETRRVYHICYSFFFKMLEARLPKDWDPRAGRPTLVPLVESAGYIADDATWTSGLTKFYSYDTFPGDKRGGNTSWLPDEYMAYLHRAYTSRDSVLGITDSEGEFLWNAAIIMSERKSGETFTLEGDASKYPNWTKLELFDGNKKLQEKTGGGATFSFDIPLTVDTPFSQNFVVLAQGPGGPKPTHQFMLLKLGDLVVASPVGGSGGSAGTGTTGGIGGSAIGGTAGGTGEGGVGGDAGGPGAPEGGQSGSAGNEGSAGSDGTGTSDNKDSGCSIGAGRNGSTAIWSVMLGALLVFARSRRRRR
jgi:hypothetical protein